MPSVAWRDEDEETAVRDEVDGVLGRLTRDWAVSRDGARGAGPTGRTDDASAVDLDDAVFDDGETQTKRNAARFLHRSAEDEEVRAVLESMRRATLGLTERDLRAARCAASATTTARSIACTWTGTRREPYVMDGVLPPWYAKTYYKVVAVVRGDERDGTDAGSLGFRLTRGSGGEGGSGGASVAARSPESGRVSFVSVYDGVTEYTRRAPPCATRRGRTTKAACTSRRPSRGACGATATSSRSAALCSTSRAPSRARDAGTRTERTTPCSTARSSRSRACTWTRSCPTPPPGALGIQARHRAFLKTKKSNASPDANAHKLLNELSGSPPARARAFGALAAVGHLSKYS